MEPGKICRALVSRRELHGLSESFRDGIKNINSCIQGGVDGCQTFGFVGRSVKIGHSHAAKADRSNRRPVFTKRTQREIGLIRAHGKKSVERDRCQFFAVAVSSDFDALEYIVDTIQRRLWPRRKLRGCLSAAADRS
jgi:hypothetical protein